MSRPVRHRGESRPCPVPFCGSIARKGQLMCRECWSRVPQKLKNAVSRTWRDYRSKLASRASPLARLDVRKVYLDASQAAIDAAEAGR